MVKLGFLISVVMLIGIAFLGKPVADAQNGIITVTILKFIDGTMATETTANGTDFQMQSSWDAENIGGAGSGSFALSTDNAIDFQAVTPEMSLGADYSIHEVMNTDVGESCSEGKPFALKGYTTGNTLVEAQNQVPIAPFPEFTNITSNKFVIVWNESCSQNNQKTNTSDKKSGQPEAENGIGILEVTRIEPVNSGENMWTYVFSITIPSNENKLSMKFSNWLQGEGTGTIPAVNNIRVSSKQAENDAAVFLTETDTYSSPINITEDLNPSLPGFQVKVRVEVSIPEGTPTGSYTTNYGVSTQ